MRHNRFYVMPGVSDLQARVEAEFEAYYSTYDPCTEELLAKLDHLMDGLVVEYSYEKKTAMHELFCRECPVHLFRENPFFFEISSGRPRHSWGGLDSPVGRYLQLKTRDLWEMPYVRAVEKDREEGFFHGWSPFGIDHHCPGYDKILSKGILGIIAEAQAMLDTCEDPRKQAFYRCVIRSNQALIGLADRFAAEAARLAAAAKTPEEAAHYEKIRAAASRVPANPPESFYEALSVVLFYRECVGSIEGIGFSTFAQVDRLLYPYYEADLSAGKITRDEAMALICQLLLYTQVRFDYHSGQYNETSTTIEIGGCDSAGNVIYNELTEIILDAVMNTRSTATKINCRISRQHPKAFLEKIAQVQLEELPTVMMHNDDVLIPARVRQGQAVEDVRLYVGCGCHEIVLSNSEVCTRADSWISLPRILLQTLSDNENFDSYEALFDRFVADVKAYHNRITSLKNAGEALWSQCDPLVLYSSSLKDCLEKGLDVTEGGARYNTTMLSMLGTATLIDSLYAIKRIVFDEKTVTYSDFKRIVAENFRNDEVLRQHILNKLPKHGTNDPVLNAFSVQVLEALSQVSGQINARGGKYMPAFYPHSIFNDLGWKIGATPDGRLANTPLSRGVSPSEFIKTDSVLDLVHSMKPIDFTGYADSFCTEVTLPKLPNDEQGKQILTAVMEGFLDAEGSSLQFNLLSRDTLIDAQKHPEKHQNLMVRVCGFSAAFTALNRGTQDEIINRAIR